LLTQLKNSECPNTAVM